MMASIPTNPGFEKLKGLVGEWEAPMQEGKIATVSYKLTAGGSTLMETLSMPEGEMLTVYTPDGKRLLLTHYCMAMNQPRMRAEPSAGDIQSLAFKFVDATNLSGPKAMHMHNLTVTFGDADHFSQEWMLRNEGKDSPKIFKFERTKT